MTVCDIYCRVSTLEQAEEGYSIGEQESRLKMYAEAQGWIVHEVLTDGGFSGSNLERPAVQKLIADAQAHRINKVLVYKLDRLSRSQRDTLYMIEEVFLKNSVDFVSMTESLDTSTPFGLAMIGILSVFAQLERSNITQRMMLGRDARVKSGKYNGHNNDIVGYHYDGERVYQDDYEAAVIRSVFNWFIAGESNAEIARKLTKMNFRGHEWVANKVLRIITQPLYIGLQRWKGETIRVENCDPIISDQVWEAAQRERARRSSNQQPKRAGKHATLLGGIIWCGCCGRRALGYSSGASKGHKGKYVYQCRNQQLRQHGFKHEPCSNPSVLARKIDGAVIEQIKRLRFDENGLNSALVGEGINSYVQQKQALEQRIEAIEKQKGRLVDLYALGTVSFADITKKIDALAAEQEGLRIQIEEMKNPSGSISAEEAKILLQTFNNVVDFASLEELQDIVHQLIQSVSFDHDEVTIKWNFSIS